MKELFALILFHLKCHNNVMFHAGSEQRRFCLAVNSDYFYMQYVKAITNIEEWNLF